MSAQLVTASGRKIVLPAPSSCDIDFNDIAHGLSHLCRFNGHTPVFYSVARHSLLMLGMVCAEARPWALLHDAHEAYVGDLITPVKHVMAQGATGADAPYFRLRDAFDAAIFTAAGLGPCPPSPISREIASADRRLLDCELRILMGEGGGDDWGRVAAPAIARIKEIGDLPPSQVRRVFLAACHSLLPCFSFPESRRREARP